MSIKSSQKSKPTAIELSSLPLKSNLVPSLFKFYKKFGHIVSIYSAGTKAIIEYETYIEAKLALEDPKPFMGNRFIRLRYVQNPKKSPNNLEQFVNLEQVLQVNEVAQKQIQDKLNETKQLQASLKAENPLPPPPQNKTKYAYELTKEKVNIIRTLSNLIDESDFNSISKRKEKEIQLNKRLQEIDEFLKNF